MSQHLLDRCADAEALAAARLLGGAGAMRLAIDFGREATNSPGNERRARWLLALAEVQGETAAGPVEGEREANATGLQAAGLHATGLQAIGLDLRSELEGVLDEPPSDGTALDELRSRARRLLGAEEALQEAMAAAVDGDIERCESALSLALTDAQDFGPREEARRCARAAEVLLRRREHTRARSLLRVAQARYAESGAPALGLAVALRLGDDLWLSGDLGAASTVFDEARASARMHERSSEELAFLRRLLALAALRHDPRAVRRLAQEVEERAAALPDSAARERAISHWVTACVVRRMGERMQALAALSRTLRDAELARDMPIAWLAAAQLGEPLPNELIRRLQRPPVEASDLLEAATSPASRDDDPDLKRGWLEGALRLLPSADGGSGDAGRGAAGYGPMSTGALRDTTRNELRSRCEAALEALPHLDLA